MRIGIDITSALKSQRTGVEEYVYQLMTHMLASENARGHEFFLFSHDNRDIVLQILGNLPPNAQVISAPYRPLWHQTVLSVLLRKTKPDIFFSPAHPLPLRWLSVGIPAVATIHGVEWERCPWAYSFLQKQYLHWATRKTIQNAKGIIAVSEHTKKGIEDFFPIETPIRVIRHGVNTEQNTELRIPACQGLALAGRQNTGAKNILFIGRKDKRKNIKGIVEAFNILRNKTSISFAITIVGPRGNDSFATYLQSQNFGHAKLENINRFISEQEKEKVYRNADIFIFPSFDEGFGMPILEAQGHGIPVVASSFLQEIGGEGAIYCDPTKPENIATSLLRMMSNKELYEDMQKKAYENVLRFTWEKCASNTLEFIECVYENR